MTDERFRDPSADEAFYARALATLSGPRARTAMVMRVLNAVYWLIVITALTWLAEQALYRPLPVTDRSQTVVTQRVKAGDPVKVSYHLNRRKICAADTYWQETDGSGEVHRFGPVHVVSAGDTGPATLTYAWPTARTASPGPSRLRVAIEFQCPDNYLEAFYPATEVLPDLEYETLPHDGTEASQAGPP